MTSAIEMTQTTMSDERKAWIARLWATELFLAFDGEHLHIKDVGSFYWKTGERVTEILSIPEERMNVLSTNDQERVSNVLFGINKTYLKDMEDND